MSLILIEPYRVARDRATREGRLAAFIIFLLLVFTLNVSFVLYD